jgi:hypothetical protein
MNFSVPEFLLFKGIPRKLFDQQMKIPALSAKGV